MEIKATEIWTYLGSLLGFITFGQTLINSILPAPIRNLFSRIFARLMDSLSRYTFIDIPEYDDATLNELYSAIKLHLSGTSSSAAKRVKLCRATNSNDFTYSPANNERVPATYEGAEIWWEHHASQRQPQNGAWPTSWRTTSDEKRTFILKIHKKDKERILVPYMDHILKQAKEIRRLNRERLLYTNSRGDSYSHPWESVPFRHPSTFDTLALDPVRKAAIRGDLQSFANGEQFYKKTGRAWKRGYLLYGPPGTGKSSMIAAMANFLQYDVYDLELTQVRSNAELRKLLLRTTNKAIIVIEDIDCSLTLTNRAKKPKRESKVEPLSDRGNPEEPHSSSMTLSGLLNFTDGLWSCCGNERIFVFTTNHIEKLDPALLRSGRMDMHILMSFCTFPAFKILAVNYLDIEDHYLFPKVEQIIDDAHMTPAEVSEILVRNRDNHNAALEELVAELEVAKEKPWPPPVKEEVIVEDVEEVKQALEEKSDKGDLSKLVFRCQKCEKGEELGQPDEAGMEETEKKVDTDCVDKSQKKGQRKTHKAE